MCFRGTRVQHLGFMLPPQESPKGLDMAKSDKYGIGSGSGPGSVSAKQVCHRFGKASFLFGWDWLMAFGVSWWSCYSA